MQGLTGSTGLAADSVRRIAKSAKLRLILSVKEDSMTATTPSVRSKLFVLDTNVILHDAGCLWKFKEHDIAVPITVLEEQDRFKTATRSKVLKSCIPENACCSTYLDSLSNGLSYLINRMVGQPIYAHITLEKGERSELAELASNLL